MQFYSKLAGPSLRAKLQALADTDPGDRMSLVEEIDVARVLALEHMKLFELVVLAPPEGSVPASGELKIAVQRGTTNAIDRVAELVRKAAQVKSLIGGYIDIEQVDWLITQVVAVIEEHVGEDEELCARIAKGVRDIKLPGKDRKNVAVATAAEIRQALSEAAAMEGG